jgi:hypothetical protein
MFTFDVEEDYKATPFPYYYIDYGAFHELANGLF